MKDSEKRDKSNRSKVDTTPATDRTENPNPPRTTNGKWTTPKFGSAGSGGAELEPGPEKD